MKLTAAQTRVVELMEQGWELGEDVSSFSGHAWLQKGGLGHGGSSEKVSRATVHALVSKKVIITSHMRFPTRTYVLKGEE